MRNYLGAFLSDCSETGAGIEAVVTGVVVTGPAAPCFLLIIVDKMQPPYLGSLAREQQHNTRVTRVLTANRTILYKTLIPIPYGICKGSAPTSATSTGPMTKITRVM